MKNQESLQVNSVVSSAGPIQLMLSNSPPPSEQTLAIIPASSSSSVEGASAESKKSTESKIKARAKETLLALHTLVTPVRHIVRPRSEQTPTSKLNVPSSGKKSYVLSVSPIPVHTTQISSDNKATTEAEGKAKAPQPASSVELSPPDVEHKAKAAHQLLRDFPSTDPSLLAKDIQKKRDRPATSAPAAKKLFRDDAPSKIEKRQ